MKRLVLLLTLTGFLSVPFEGFAKSPKRTTATIKYENGDKYVGEITKYPIKYIRLPILPIRFVAKNNKIRNGKGVMYYANGDSFDGSWNNDSPSYGTYQYANGDCFKGSLKNNYLFKGQLVFTHKGSVKFGDKLWEYPANSSFNGELGGRRPLSGSFDCTLTSTTGDEFTGTIMSGNLDKGTILFANGDTFEGSFIQSAPSFGKYRYANTTKIAGTTYKWIVPAGCTFNGDVQAFTGMVDLEVTNESGDRFIGSFIKGQPDEGTMTFANGTAETGKWHDGMSPSAYKAYLAKQEAERKRQEAEQKRQKAIADSKDLREFEKYVQSRIRDCYGFSFDIWHPISNGAYIIRDRTSEKYLCIDMQYQSGVIEITIKSQKGELHKLYIRRIEISKRPSIEINRVYPEDWPYIYYKLSSVVDTKEKVKSPSGDWWIGSVSFYLADDNYERTIDRLRNYWSRKFGSYWASVIINKEFKLGMTVEMVEAIKGKGDISRDISANGEIIYLSYGYTTYFVFVNGKLRNYTIDK